MARYQKGSLCKKDRAEGETWIYRYQVTRSDGKRVEHTTPIGLVSRIGPRESQAWREVDRQGLRQVINPLGPRGKPVTFGQLAEHYMQHELQATIAKAFSTIKTYKRHLRNRVVPRWGKVRLSAMEPLEIEQWLKQLKRNEHLQDPTLEKIRRVMSLTFQHGQRYGFVPRDDSGNPMNWVRQSTTSDYRAIIMTPKQAFEILLNVPEPRRTLVLTDAATALRVSEILGLTWADLDFENLVIEVKRAYVWGRFKEPKSKASKQPVPMHALLAGFLLAWRERTPYARDSDFVFPSSRLKGKKPLSASIMVKDYLRPAAVKAGVLNQEARVRFGFHNFRHSLASTLVQMKVDPKTVQEMLRQADVSMTLQLYTQSDMELKREAQGEFLNRMLGDRIHLLTTTMQ